MALKRINKELTDLGRYVIFFFFSHSPSLLVAGGGVFAAASCYSLALSGASAVNINHNQPSAVPCP